MLGIRNLSKSYCRPNGTVAALANVSLEVPAGEFLAVQGPSGSGKTTLLLAAGGLLAPDAGSVGIDGQDPYRLDPDRRARFRAVTVGFVFQQFHLIPYLSVMDNILTPALARALPDAGDRAQQLIARFGLAGRVGHLPGELSVGERQRTALARALLGRPKLILADEPTGNLDEDNARVVLESLAEFSAAGGAVLLVTHNATVARYAERTAHLKNGCLCHASAGRGRSWRSKN